jgi:hypothetical protein
LSSGCLERLRVDLTEDLLLGEVLRADRDVDRRVGVVLLDLACGLLLRRGGAAAIAAVVIVVVAAAGDDECCDQKHEQHE